MPHFEFAKILMAINYQDARLKVNGVDVEANFVAVMSEYNAQQAAKRESINDLMQQIALQKGLPMASDDPNRPETEEDGIRAGQFRKLQVIHNHKVNRLRDIDTSLPQEERDRLAAEINDEFEQRRAFVLKNQRG